MFRFLFNYSPTVFSKGQFVLLGSWPPWMLAAVVVGAAGFLAWMTRRRRREAAANLTGVRLAAIWLLQTALASLVLVLLWQPALLVATLKPQQNIVAVVVDDSRSMAIQENGATRREQAVRVLNSGLLEALRQKFQVRLHRLGERLERIDKPDQLSASARATRIGANLKQVAAEAAGLPIGAVVLLSDGADNTGGIDLETLAEIRRQRIPVHTVGFGRERFARDVEISDVQVAARALADSRLSAQATLRQRGYAGTQARLTLREGGKVLATRQITLKADGVEQSEPLVFDAGPAGAKNLELRIETLPGEENANNNAVSRLVNVEAAKPRVLYMEGEPRWEFKFIRRALDEERNLQLASILRTTQNKIYRQGIDSAKELEEGFPSKVEDLFGFQGIVLGSVEAGYFTAAQLELIRQFVDRRGGGLLLLAGRAALAEGGWARSPLADLLPVTLPDRKGTFRREPANAELTAAGRESLICRLEENPERNAERWKKLPYLANYQDIGTPKPGAVVLAEFLPTSKSRFPLLVTQNYGRGRTAVFATAGSWRWQMLQDVSDRTHEMFWRQLLRWLADSPGRLASSTPRPVLTDETRVQLQAQVRDRTYLPMPDARVQARITGPEGLAETAELTPDPRAPGAYSAEWAAQKPGSYMAEIVATRGNEEVGRDVLMFRREDGVAENFRAEQNRELLQKLSSETGGQYYRPGDWKKLGEEIAYSEAGITVREAKELWNMPAVFMLALALRGAEWLLRRKWGAV